MDGFAFWAIALLFAGLIVLVIEIFVPSGGVLAAITSLLFILSVVCAWNAWWSIAPYYWWSYTVFLVLVIPGTIVGMFTLLPHTPTGKRILLEAPDADSLTPFAEESARLTKLIGETGEAATPLVPGGIVLIDGQRIDAVSEGLTIDRHAAIEVVGVRGTRLVVRPALNLPKPEKPRAKETTLAKSPWEAESANEVEVSPDEFSSNRDPAKPPASADRLDFEIPDE